MAKVNLLVDLVILEKRVQIKTELLLEKKLMSFILPTMLQLGLHEQLWDSSIKLIESSNNLSRIEYRPLQGHVIVPKPKNEKDKGPKSPIQ